MKWPAGLVKGQLWKVDNAYLQIVDLGKRLIHYRMLRQPGQETALTRMIRPDAFAVFLHKSGAVSLGPDSAAAL